MKAIIDNKIYDTNKSELIFQFRSNFSYKNILGITIYNQEETKIYKTKKRNYFFFYDDINYPSRIRIEPTNEKEVKKIISSISPDRYIELFGTTELEEA